MSRFRQQCMVDNYMVTCFLISIRNAISWHTSPQIELHIQCMSSAYAVWATCGLHRLCSAGCNYTAISLECSCSVQTCYHKRRQCTCSTIQCTLQLHCSIRSVPAATLLASGSVRAVFLQCTCSVHCSYTETILPIHSTSVWVISRRFILNI